MKESTGTWGNGFPGEFTEEEIYEFFNTGILKDNSEYMKLRKDMAKYAYWYYKLLVKRYSLSEVMDKNLKSLLSFSQPITSCMSYRPAPFPARYLAASTAPFPKTALEYARWLKVMTSSGPAKITS